MLLTPSDEADSKVSIELSRCCAAVSTKQRSMGWRDTTNVEADKILPVGIKRVVVEFDELFCK